MLHMTEVKQFMIIQFTLQEMEEHNILDENCDVIPKYVNQKIDII